MICFIINLNMKKSLNILKVITITFDISLPRISQKHYIVLLWAIKNIFRVTAGVFNFIL